MSELIKMRRTEPQHEGGPVTAEVHPDEVSNYQVENWFVVEAETETSEPGAPQAPAEPKAKRERKPKPEAPQAPAEHSDAVKE